MNNDNDDKRRWLERCQKQAKTVINPIVDWNDENIKDYIQSEKIDLNPLYCELKTRKANGKEGTWQTGYDVFRWWLDEDFNQYEIGEEFYQNEE